MSELQVQRCDRCGAKLFPERLRCPRCGGRRFTSVPAGTGRVEEETTVRRPAEQKTTRARLGSVRLSAGPVVIARLTDGIEQGTEVRLDHARDGAVWAKRSSAGPAERCR